MGTIEILKIKREWNDEGFYEYDPPTILVHCCKCGYGDGVYGEKGAEAFTFQMIEKPDKIICPRCKEEDNKIVQLEPVNELEYAWIINSD